MKLATTTRTADCTASAAGVHAPPRHLLGV